MIFEEFKRLDSHQTRAEKGLGLGLAIADGLCRVLGHRLKRALVAGQGQRVQRARAAGRNQTSPPPKTAAGNRLAIERRAGCCAWITKKAS